MQCISDIEDVHVELTLLRNCTTVSKMNYLFRVVPPSLTAHGAKTFDTQVEQCVRNMVGGVLAYESFVELGLPIGSDNPSFGIGLYAYTCTAAPAFIASSALVWPILRSFMATAGMDFQNDEVEGIYNHWKPQIYAVDDPELDVVLSLVCPPQRVLTRLVLEKFKAIFLREMRSLRRFGHAWEFLIQKTGSSHHRGRRRTSQITTSYMAQIIQQSSHFRWENTMYPS